MHVSPTGASRVGILPQLPALPPPVEIRIGLENHEPVVHRDRTERHGQRGVAELNAEPAAPILRIEPTDVERVRNAALMHLSQMFKVLPRFQQFAWNGCSEESPYL